MSTRVWAYLDAQKIRYDTVNHAHSNSSIEAAMAAQLSPSSIAKAVLLEDHEGRHLMAVLPSNHKISLQKLQRQLDLELHFVDEQQVYAMFNDCDPGAVPAIAQAYNMNAIYDEALSNRGDVYLEAGDHETLIHLTQDQFGKLMQHTKHSVFSGETFH
jgi:Ala-tRNA(Pro) deacylase